MKAGQRSVGHPIDVASGTMYSTHRDLYFPGSVNLTWERYYTTSLLGLPHTPLGPGWTTRYFCTLTDTGQEYHLFAPEGYLEIFADPGGTIERGGCVRNLGTCQELVKRDGRYIVTRWDVGTGEVERYLFKEGRKGEAWPIESIEDVTGQALDLVWDQRSRLTEIRQRLEKRTLVLDYSDRNQIISVSFRHPDGQTQNLINYEYDRDGRLSAASDAMGYADRYEYDSAGRMTREIVKDGGVFYFRYDQKGRCVKTSGLDRYDEKTLRYFDFGWTEVTDSLGQVTRYQWLPSGQIATEIDPLGGRRRTEYDDHGRITAIIEATGATTKHTYDQFGNSATITDALGNTHAFTYNDQHLPVSMTDPFGQVWRRAYDSNNRLIGTVDPLGHRWQLRYDPEGNVAEIENPLGARRRQRYTQGRLQAVTDWLGNETRFVLDPSGRVIERQGPLGETIRFRYDPLGNPVEVTFPGDRILRATYDSAGNLTSFTDGNGHTARFRYGPCQRLLERMDPIGGVVRYLWGSEPERLEQIINEKGEAHTFFHDEAGRIIREQSFDGAERHFRYDAAGHLMAYLNANGETIRIERDALHRMTRQTLPDGEQFTYGFDAVGNLVTAANADMTTVFERDPLGRIRREVQGEQWVENHYDALGNCIRTVTSLGHTVDYEIDPNGSVSKLTTLGNQSLEFKHQAGREIRRQLPGGMVMEQRYDAVGHLIEQRVASGRAINSGSSVIPPQNDIIRRSYAYDRNGLLTSIVDGNWGRVDYVYDPAERLLQAIRQQGLSEAFSYDPADNITGLQTRGRNLTDEALVYGPGNRLLQKGSTRYEYDGEGRRIKKIEEADGAAPKIWIYEWNALDWLKAVTRPDGEVWRYKYDAMARRIEKAGPKKQWNFLWDNNVVIQELTNHDQVVAWITKRGTFSPLAKVHGQGLYPIITDHLGTPREMLDSAGRLAWAASLSASGLIERKQSSQRTQDCHIRFQGQWFDEESGLHYSRFRYYDPTVTGFITQDPIGLAGGLNEYRYAKNPILWIDPFGLAARIDENGFFARSHEYGRGRSPRGRVSIPYQGSRSRDFTVANRAAGFSSTPDGYTWHHANYDPVTGYGDMQLVRHDPHAATSHAGGVSEFVQSTGLKYDTPEAVRHVEAEGRLEGRPCRGS